MANDLIETHSLPNFGPGPDDGPQSDGQNQDNRCTDNITMAGDTRSPLFDPSVINDIPVRITAVLGRRRITVQDLLAMDRGSVIDLDRKVGEPLDLYVNDTLIGRGELVMTDGGLGVCMTEIVHTPDMTGDAA